MYKSAARFRCDSSRINVGGAYAERSSGDGKVVNKITSRKKNTSLPSVKHLKKLIGKKILGMVVNIKEYGAFVKLYTGETGLLHISKIKVAVSDALKLGDKIEVILLNIEHTNNGLRIQLSLLDSDLAQKCRSKENTK